MASVQHTEDIKAGEDVERLEAWRAGGDEMGQQQAAWDGLEKIA